MKRERVLNIVLVIVGFVRYFNAEPALWECSACRELFSVLSVDGVYVGYKDILGIFQKHCRAEDSTDKESK
jgi:hypothetical protein